MKRMFTLLLTLVAILCAQPVSAQSEMKITKLQWEQLPDMNTARMAHRIFPSGDNFVVVGGHTTGFDREQSAEIYKDGGWSYVTSPSYVHDNAGSVTLDDGRTLVFGGHNGDFGTGGGNSGIDIYNPATESFSDGGNMSVGRAMCVGVLAAGKVFITGDYWSSSSSRVVDVWEGGSQSTLETSLSRSHEYPYLLPTSDGSSILVVGNTGSYSGLSAVDKINTATGEITQITLELLEEWQPMWPGEGADMPDFSIGGGRYVVLARSFNGYGDYGIILIDADAETASLLVTIPKLILDETIDWGGYMIVNATAGEAYVLKSVKVNDESYNFYIATVDYNAGAVTEIAYVTGFPVSGGYMGFAILPDGRILGTGGSVTGESNFDASNKVFAFTPNGGELISSIENVTNPTTTTSAVYSLNGQQLPQMQRGVNIVRQSDGTVKKIIVK